MTISQSRIDESVIQYFIATSLITVLSVFVAHVFVISVIAIKDQAVHNL